MIAILLTIIIVFWLVLFKLNLKIHNQKEAIDYYKKLNLLKTDMITEYFAEMKRLEIEKEKLEKEYILVKRKKGVNDE